jgi:acetyl-CoA carboxylase alpha subunit
MHTTSVHSASGGLRIADLRPASRAELLDELVDRATLLKPESRPNMEAVATDLRAWLRLRSARRPTEPVALDVSDLVGAFRAKLRGEIEAENTEAERIRPAKVPPGGWKHWPHRSTTRSARWTVARKSAGSNTI